MKQEKRPSLPKNNMEREEFFAINCRNTNRVMVTIHKVSIDNGTGSMVKKCPRIDSNTAFSVEVASGVPISVTCENTNCPFHEKNQKILAD